MILITVKSYELEDTKETNLALPHYPCTKSNKKKCFLILKIWLNMYTAIKRKPQAINEFFDCRYL